MYLQIFKKPLLRAHNWTKQISISYFLEASLLTIFAQPQKKKHHPIMSLEALKNFIDSHTGITARPYGITRSCIIKSVNINDKEMKGN